MSTERSYVDYLVDILDAFEKVRQFIHGMTFETFVHDDKTTFAVVRALEIVGEATKRIPLAIRDGEPAIPWRAMAGMRDKLSHDYIGVNLAVVWKTVTEDLPVLEPILQRMLTEAQQQDIEE
jgi:uncharacterized protein with HEPN domain